MSIKLNKYNLPNSTVKLMKSILDMDEGPEMGFSLCADKKGNLRARNLCSGNICDIAIKQECGDQEKYTGLYHSHPFDDSHASATDLRSCGVNHNICVGGLRDHKGRCYTWKHTELTIEKYNEFIDLLLKGIRQIDNPIYKKNFECIKEFAPVVQRTNMFSLADAKVGEQQIELRRAKQEKAPKDKIDDMEKALKLAIENREKISSDTRKKITELVSKYYEENELW